MTRNKLFNFCQKCIHLPLCIIVCLLVLTALGSFQMFISKQQLINVNRSVRSLSSYKKFYKSGNLPKNVYEEGDPVVLVFVKNLFLLLVFCGQHSIMGKSLWKDWLASSLGVTVSQRIVYNIASSFFLMAIVIHWQSIPQVYLWLIDTSDYGALWGFFCLFHVFCWFMFGLQVVLMDVWELLGIQQVYNFNFSLPDPLWQKATLLREIYSGMRHPGPLLLTLMLWVHPIMTLDRLLLASVLTSYMIGRHSFEVSHLKFAKNHFRVKTSESSIKY